jgi:hypothetical protein
MASRISIAESVVLFVVTAFCVGITADAVLKQHTEPINKHTPVQKIGSTFSPAPTVELNNPLAPSEPTQEELSEPKTFPFKGYSIRELAHFQAKGLLLSKINYSSASGEHRGVLSPSDFAIGWGPMSIPNNLKNFTYFQKGRFFYYASVMSFAETAARYHADWHVSNIHLIPADNNIAEAIDRIKPRDIVTLKGSLVEVFYQHQRIWKSSLSRTDTGDGACELLFVTYISWAPAPEGAVSLIPLPSEPPISSH